MGKKEWSGSIVNLLKDHPKLEQKFYKTIKDALNNAYNISIAVGLGVGAGYGLEDNSERTVEMPPQGFQLGGEFVEKELTDFEIAQLRKEGYQVEII